MKFRDGIVDLTPVHNKNSSPRPSLTFDHHAGTPSSDSRIFYWDDRTLRFLITGERERKLWELPLISGTTTYFRNYSDPAEDEIRFECHAILRAFVQSNFRSSLRVADEFDA